MIDFTPFDTPFEALTSADLTSLSDVQEGWYVEYKREVPRAGAIAKSIAAMANTYGGWVFFGVEEHSRHDQAAGSFPGVDVTELDGLLQRVRHAAASHLNPVPHYDLRVLHGPDAACALPADRAVIVLRVPRSQNTPVVHSSGQIYRRVGDGSEPRPETDRFILDRLWERRKDIEREYKAWLKRRPELTRSEKQQPYLRLMMTIDLWRERDLWCDLELSEIRKLLGVRDQPFSVPFDSVRTQPDGIIARQGQGNDPTALGLTWQLRRDLRSDILLPIHTYQAEHAVEIGRRLKEYEHANRFAKVLGGSNLSRIAILDLNLIYTVLVGLLVTYEVFLQTVSWTGAIHFKLEFLNVRRAIPFLDVESVMSDFEAYGVPVCLNDRITVHPSHTPGSFEPLEPTADFDGLSLAQLRAAKIFNLVGQAVGLSWPEGDNAAGHLIDLVSAGNRGLAQQKARSAN